MPSTSFQKIQAPLASESFLRASHFKLGFDQRPEGSTVISPYRIDYPPRWGTYQRQPILPPKCADVLNQEMGDSWDTRSESYLSYPSWPLDVKSAIYPPISNFQMHADPRHSILTSITRESYSYPPSLPHTTPNRVDKWDDSFPSGDKEKEPLPKTLYQQSYPAYEGVVPVVKAPNLHLGGGLTLKGDGHNYFNTSYKSQFTGEWAPPIKTCNENVVSIVFGDPRHLQAVSEQKHAYTVQKPEGQRYDPHIASAKVHHSNIHPGDGQHRFSTIMSESYLWNQPGMSSSKSYSCYMNPASPTDFSYRKPAGKITNNDDMTLGGCIHHNYLLVDKCLNLITRLDKSHSLYLSDCYLKPPAQRRVLLYEERSCPLKDALKTPGLNHSSDEVSLCFFTFVVFPDPPSYSNSKKNESFILLGDHNEKRRCTSITNNQFYYKEPNAKDFATQPRTQPLTKLCLGDKQLPLFQSIHHSDYQPPPEKHKMDSKNKTSKDSHVFFKYEGPGVPTFRTTTTQDMLVPHQGKKYQLTEEQLQRVKYSHLVHPWKGKRWFSTEQRDAYTDKYSGPITLATADFQGSTVPLGTMVKYQPRKKFGS